MTMHPFEKRGLGFAPFRFSHLTREGGGCAWCGAILTHAYHVKDVEGREITVGSDCVLTALADNADWKLRSDIERAAAKLRSEMAQERYQNRFTACLAALKDDPTLLTDLPHPSRPNETLRSDVMWLLRGNKNSKQLAFGVIEKAVAARAAGPQGYRQFGIKLYRDFVRKEIKWLRKAPDFSRSILRSKIAQYRLVQAALRPVTGQGSSAT